MATSAPITLSEFKVDLDQLDQAINRIAPLAQDIEQYCQVIQSTSVNVTAIWSGPASQAFEAVAQGAVTQMNDLTLLLGDMVNRMQTAYNNYLNMEQTNFQNVAGK